MYVVRRTTSTRAPSGAWQQGEGSTLVVVLASYSLSLACVCHRILVRCALGDGKWRATSTATTTTTFTARDLNSLNRVFLWNDDVWRHTAVVASERKRDRVRQQRIRWLCEHIPVESLYLPSAARRCFVRFSPSSS